MEGSDPARLLQSKMGDECVAVMGAGSVVCFVCIESVTLRVGGMHHRK